MTKNSNAVYQGYWNMFLLSITFFITSLTNKHHLLIFLKNLPTIKAAYPFSFPTNVSPVKSIISGLFITSGSNIERNKGSPLSRVDVAD